MARLREAFALVKTIVDQAVKPRLEHESLSLAPTPRAITCTRQFLRCNDRERETEREFLLFLRLDLARNAMELFLHFSAEADSQKELEGPELKLNHRRPSIGIVGKCVGKNRRTVLLVLLINAARAK